MLQEIITKIQTDIKGSLQSQRKVLPHTSNWASVLPAPCVRQQVYYRTDWEKQTLGEAYLQGIFNTGNLVEDMTRLTLNKIGLMSDPKWELLKQPDKINDKALRELQIGSVTDVFLVTYAEGTGKPKVLCPVEIKSVNPNIFAGLSSIDDFNKYWWMKKYRGQLMLYEYGSNFDTGVFLLVNKTNWWDYKFFELPMDYGYMEGLLDRARLINTYVAEKKYPERIDDRAECEHCPFVHICLPDECGDGLALDNDPHLLELLDERDRLREAAGQYDKVMDMLKTQYWERTEVGAYLIGGKYQVKLSEYDRKSYNVPPDVKEKYREVQKCTKAVITKLL